MTRFPSPFHTHFDESEGTGVENSRGTPEEHWDMVTGDGILVSSGSSFHSTAMSAMPEEDPSSRSRAQKNPEMTADIEHRSG